MPLSSASRGQQEEDRGLDALRNPFRLPGRFVKGAFTSVDDILRGLGRMAGAPLSDIFAEPIRGAWGAARGEPYQMWDEGGEFHLSSYEDVFKPVGQTMANTGNLIGEVATAPRAFWDDDHKQTLLDRAQEFNDDPFMFTLEHVGNVAIGAGTASAPARAGLAASRTNRAGLSGPVRNPAAAAAQSLRPLAGREVRQFSRGRTRDWAAQARERGQRFTPEQVTTNMGDIVGHPYITAARGVAGSRFVQGARSQINPAAQVGDAAAPTARDAVLPELRALDAEIDARVDSTLAPNEVSPVTGDRISPMAHSAARNPLDDIAPDARAVSSENIPEGTTTDPSAAVGFSERLGQSLGSKLETIRTSRGYQDNFSPQVREARKLSEHFVRGVRQGTGRVADALVERGLYTRAEPLGSAKTRMSYDPRHAEATMIRNIKHMHRRQDAAEWQNLIDDLTEMGAVDRITPGSIPGRIRGVGSGARTAGHALDADTISRATTRILDEVEARSGGDFRVRDELLRELMPGMDPLVMELRALNAIEEVHGFAPDTLTSAVADTIQYGERAGGLNMRAQAALREAGRDLPHADGARYNIPDEHIVDFAKLSPAEKRVFNAAVDQHLWNQAYRREPALLDEGLIPQGGTRTVMEDGARRPLQPDEPTRFPSELEDLTLTPETRGRLERASGELETARGELRDMRAQLDELVESGRPTTARRVDQQVEYRADGTPTRASMDRTFYETPTGRAIKRHQERVTEKNMEVMELASRLERLEEGARLDPANAPASAREYLVYARDVAPLQARELRSMAADAQAGRLQGDANVYRHLADELDALPRTIDDLNALIGPEALEFRLAHLRNVTETQPSGGRDAPGTRSAQYSTKLPGGLQRAGMNLDRNMTRDMRARLFTSNQEMQTFYMRQEADAWVHRAGLAHDGRKLLKDQGYSPSEIRQMSEGQVREILEKSGMREYDPQAIFNFGTSRGVKGKENLLESHWVTPAVHKAMEGPVKNPGTIERMFWEGVYDPLVNNWKVVALPLRFGWQVNNYMGNALLTLGPGGVSVRDYSSLMRASVKAVRDWDRGITNQVRVPLSKKHMGELRAKQHQLDPTSPEYANLQRMLDEGEFVFDNNLMNEISSGGLTRGSFSFLNDSSFLRDLSGTSHRNIFQQMGISGRLPDGPTPIGDVPVGQRLRNIKGSGRQFVDAAYHMNETVDNFHRAMIYMDQMMQGQNHTAGMAQITKALADYSKLTRFEQRWIKRVYPFYPWMRHMADVVARSVHPTNINSTIVFAHLTNVLGQPNEFEEMLPDWAGGHIYVGENEDGTPRFLSTRGLNPFLDVFDPLQQPGGRGMMRPVSPAFQIPYERISGISTLQGRPFSAPGQAFGSGVGDELPRPSWPEHLSRQIPHIKPIRDSYRQLMGQPLTRYGTGEAAYFEGAEDGRTAGQSWRQIFGVNIRPMDVEQMEEQRLTREYQAQVAQQRYEQQAEEHGGGTLRDFPRRATEALQELPLIPGGS